ncbi:DUF4129 domain-containing transglutaminase family protein [Salirhabdus salicampi]|uniref:DUF4129 domain-containing transglutaminase family protein n=1 Tax=Salirhabdus salicampi TaxID=476102 RepID=UPI0020C268DB|nr:DUF4129 domain-containing transglutaminase family protein [Salirhabdus salicampi]MCP8617842.1 DUF4129 domain-containing transglutaminase family protein [Salirhabdus salicampi]
MRFKSLGYDQLFINIIIYLCSFLLFLEWLKPLTEFTDTSNIGIFVFYAAFCFFISFLRLRWWISTPLKLFGLFFLLNGLYFAAVPLSPYWFQTLSLEIQHNVSALFSQQWWSMTPMFRTLLFLILLWLMSYLLYYWFIVAKKTFFFILLTFIYLTVIDTFTMFDGTYAIIRSFIIAIIVLGVSNIYSVLQREHIHRLPKGKYAAWMLPLLFVVLFSSLVGFATPKYEPIWPDPVPFLKSTAESVSGTGPGPGVKKIGYGEDDTQLGGAFIQDETVVFYAYAEEDQYWRIETKDVYTGKGWVRSDTDYSQRRDGNIDMRTFTNNVDTDSKTASITFEEGQELPKVVYPYGLTGIDLGPGMSANYFQYSPDTGEILLPLNSYTVRFEQPNFTFNALRSAPETDPREIKEQFTQLPDDLPDRVRELALDISDGEDNRYDIAKSIERYLGSRYSYTTKDVPVPTEDEDYVDQFLFESLKGYCDNFSSSMVVMLRTLDIPARWVKGFTAGERVEQNLVETPIGEKYLYEIQNANAHSWVEVYFPEIGWVPFEPTRGFINEANFSSGRSIDDILNNDDDNNEEEEEEKKPEQEEAGPAGQDDQNDSGSFLSEKAVKTIAIVGSVLLVLSIILYLNRYKWLAWYNVRKYRKKEDIQSYRKAYRFLLALLSHKGMKKNNGQTLREYARQIDQTLGTIEMQRLTHEYERIVYRNEQDEGQWKKMKDLWEQMVIRVMS